MILDLPTVFKASRREPPGISSITIRMYSPGVYWILEELFETNLAGPGNLSTKTGLGTVFFISNSRQARF